jgi:hypothetical protein
LQEIRGSKMTNYRHQCPDWDYLEIDYDSPEFDCCTCNIDSDGNGPEFHTGDRVYVLPNKREATVVTQMKYYDMNESFWGNLRLLYDDGSTGESHGWQVKKI